MTFELFSSLGRSKVIEKWRFLWILENDEIPTEVWTPECRQAISSPIARQRPLGALPSRRRGANLVAWLRLDLSVLRLCNDGGLGQTALPCGFNRLRVPPFTKPHYTVPGDRRNSQVVYNRRHRDTKEYTFVSSREKDCRIRRRKAILRLVENGYHECGRSLSKNPGRDELRPDHYPHLLAPLSGAPKARSIVAWANGPGRGGAAMGANRR